MISIVERGGLPKPLGLGVAYATFSRTKATIGKTGKKPSI